MRSVTTTGGAVQLTKSMSGVVSGMDKVLASMNVDQISTVMDKFERQFDDLDVASGCVWHSRKHICKLYAHLYCAGPRGPARLLLLHDAPPLWRAPRPLRVCVWGGGVPAGCCAAIPRRWGTRGAPRPPWGGLAARDPPASARALWVMDS